MIYDTQNVNYNLKYLSSFTNGNPNQTTNTALLRPVLNQMLSIHELFVLDMPQLINYENVSF